MKNLARIVLFLTLLFFPASTVGIDGSESWCRLYFTRPETGGHRFTSQNPERGIISLIRSSRVSVRGAFYDLSTESVIKELIAAMNRGVKVQLVLDDSKFSTPSVERLMRAGASVHHDGRSALMHNKFLVVDGRVLWTGSYNVTDNGATRNNNNSLEIRSKKIAALYDDEFSEMFDRNIYGAGGISLLKGKSILFSRKGFQVEVLFAPEDSVEDRLCSLLRGARRSVTFMAFSFTNKRLSGVMLERAWEGIDINGVIEKRGSGSRYSEYIRFAVESSRIKKVSDKLNILNLKISQALSGRGDDPWGEIRVMAGKIKPAGLKRRSKLFCYLREIADLAGELKTVNDRKSKRYLLLEKKMKDLLPGGSRYFRPGRIRVVQDSNPGVMHHKVIVIDSEILVTGSYNFSRNADTRNDENTIIIHDPTLTCRYIDEFNRLVPWKNRVSCVK